MRDGYYSDAYFTFTKTLLEADGHHPCVLMQVFLQYTRTDANAQQILAVVDKCIVQHVRAATADQRYAAQGIAQQVITRIARHK